MIPSNNCCECGALLWILSKGYATMGLQVVIGRWLKLLNPLNFFVISYVIPAQAGIQLINGFLQSKNSKGFRPLRGTDVLLDSRFRGNDELNGLSGLEIN